MKRKRRLIGVWLALLTSLVALASPAAATSSPDLIAVLTDATIKQGSEKMFRVELVGYLPGGTFEVSGAGVSLIAPHGGIKPAAQPNQWRIKLAATADATPGFRDLTYVGPDGQSDTLVNAIEVLPVVAVPDTGISGHIFSDSDGNGTKDAIDSGLTGVAVLVVAADGAITSGTSDAGGNYTLIGIAPGPATVTYSAPVGATLTTGNDVQIITVFDQNISQAAAVGYQNPAGTAVDIVSVTPGTIAAGTKAFVVVTVTGADAGATWSFSGSGLTIGKVAYSTDKVRIAVTASASAELGPRDITVVNLDGGTDTLIGALTVTP